MLNSNQFKCEIHGLQKLFLCIENYCNHEEKLLCKKCIQNHQHHLIVTSQQSMKMSLEYIKLKQSVYDDLSQLSINLTNLRQNLIRELEHIEFKVKDVLQQLKLKQSIEQTIEKYQQKGEQNLSIEDYTFIAQYLSQVSKKDNKEVKLDIDFKIQHESAQYVEQLLQNVQQKLQVLNPYRNMQKNDSKIQINQFLKLLQNEILTIKTNDIIVTTFLIKKKCKLIGYMQPCINGIDQLQEQNMLFALHQQTNLDDFIYQQMIKLNHNQQNIINNSYYIKIQPILLEKDKEYTVSLQVKNKLHLDQFYKEGIENPFIQFLKKQNDDYEKHESIDIVMNHGQFPVIILESLEK